MGKVWFVTGSNSGIGLGIAKAALASGDRVVATGRSMEKLTAAFPGASDSLELVRLDVSDASQAQSAVAQAVKRFGRIDVLVNNAGYSMLGNFEELSTEDFEKIFQANFYGTANVLRAALPLLRKQRSGHIINISSTAGAVGLKHCSAYCATKFAVEGLSTAIATEVEQFGIHVTVVEPGFFRTNLIDKGSVKYAPSTIADYAHEGTAEAMWSKYSGTQPGDPAKLGKAIVQISNMEKPLKLFVAGGDALELVTPVLEERLRTMQETAELSKSLAIS